ncbi:hypothetical protein CRG98_009790 [Punica granatum]|uniref:Uncharacterized protein n=1 Tax=Punica granatum TaxID=22663 RepID=A0A2I0KN45_PUNGR|nr:hypothetical protein CRG98_009790 [Punica granatum]
MEGKTIQQTLEVMIFLAMLCQLYYMAILLFGFFFTEFGPHHRHHLVYHPSTAATAAATSPPQTLFRQPDQPLPILLELRKLDLATPWPWARSVISNPPMRFSLPSHSRLGTLMNGPAVGLENPTMGVVSSRLGEPRARLVTQWRTEPWGLHCYEPQWLGSN